MIHTDPFVDRCLTVRKLRGARVMCLCVCALLNGDRVACAYALRLIVKCSGSIRSLKCIETRSKDSNQMVEKREKPHIIRLALAFVYGIREFPQKYYTIIYGRECIHTRRTRVRAR